MTASRDCSFRPLSLALVGAVACFALGCATQTPCPATNVAPQPAASAAPAAAPAAIVMAADQPNPAMLGGLPVLPRPSPDAEVKQRVGITDVQLSYSSPAVKGRTIWGGLLPYGELWRAGANSPTKLTVSHDFTFGGKAVPAGRYSLYAIPSEAAWTIILNRDPKNAGAFEHDPAEDVARVEVSAAAAPPRERLAFLFEDTTDDSTNLVLDWAGKHVAVAIGINTKEHVAKSVAATLENAWRPLFNAGRYAFDSGDNARALELLNKSIGIRATWWNHWWTAQVLAKQNQHAAAREHAQKAMALGEKDGVFQRAFAEQVKKALETWPES